jgi:hypothetical protein
MAENTVNEAITNLNQSLYESGQAIVESTTAAQQRNAKLAQNTFENGVEVLKSHAEATRTLSGELVQKQQEAWQAVAESVAAAQERNTKVAHNVFENGAGVLQGHAESARTLAEVLAQKQQEAWQAVAESVTAAQERNAKFAQSIFENSIEVLKSHAESTRGLMQTLIEQSHRQQEAYQVLTQASMEAYRNFLYAPFPFVQQAVEVAGSAARLGADNVEKAIRQAIENSKQATYKAAE